MDVSQPTTNVYTLSKIHQANNSSSGLSKGVNITLYNMTASEIKAHLISLDLDWTPSPFNKTIDGDADVKKTRDTEAAVRKSKNIYYPFYLVLKFSYRVLCSAVLSLIGTGPTRSTYTSFTIPHFLSG